MIENLTQSAEVRSGGRPAVKRPVERPWLNPELTEFAAFELTDDIAEAVWDMAYRVPSDIQRLVVPQFLSGIDVVGQAQTGTGKTAAFGIPIAELLDDQSPHVQAIVLVPTRELAMQVAKELSRICAYRDLEVAAVYGGAPIGPQIDQIRDGAQIVVGTPGRIMDHMGRRTLDLSRIRIAVLDEADEMLDIGFADDMERILRATPKSRQTALFSATMPNFIRTMIYKYMRAPEWFVVRPDEATVPEITQVYVDVAERDKIEAFSEIFESLDEAARILVFRRMQVGVDRLTRALSQRGYKVLGIHGGMSQAERNRAMQAFRKGTLPVLIATNVAARGLDIPDVTDVVNFDMPDNVEEYIHRIGRTGRAGRLGRSVSFVAEWDGPLFEAIQERMKGVLEPVALKLYETET